MSMLNGHVRRILHVEDNPGDVCLIGEALGESGRGYEIVVAPDGADALDYLYGRGNYAGAPRPDLILLDLNLPKKTGREVLAELKKDAALKHIPVVVFTSSSAPLDISEAYGLHANCYVTKPADLDEVFRVVGMIEAFWLGAVKLPTSSREL
ncbi:MAG TPA: response regulator [Candidatus Udaeobacter sp.]|nr:response regulator [Candidatus Udaeobacter sp.]